MGQWLQLGTALGRRLKAPVFCHILLVGAQIYDKQNSQGQVRESAHLALAVSWPACK